MGVKGLRSNLEARQTKMKFSEKIRRKINDLRKSEEGTDKSKKKKK